MRVVPLTVAAIPSISRRDRGHRGHVPGSRGEASSCHHVAGSRVPPVRVGSEVTRQRACQCPGAAGRPELTSPSGGGPRRKPAGPTTQPRTHTHTRCLLGIISGDHEGAGLGRPDSGGAGPLTYVQRNSE